MTSKTEERILKNSKLYFNDPDHHSFITKGVTKTMKNEYKENENKENDINNPFFTGIKGGSILSLLQKDIYQNYKHLNILCLKNTENDEKCIKLIMPV